MIGVYAVARMKDGGVICEIMNMEQLAKIRKVSRSGDNGPWKEWPEEMAKKSVLRRIAKYLPSSADVDQMFDHDSDNYELSPEPPEPKPVPPKKTKTRAAAVIEAHADDDGPVYDNEPPPLGEAPAPAPAETDSDPI